MPASNPGEKESPGNRCRRGLNIRNCLIASQRPVLSDAAE